MSVIVPHNMGDGSVGRAWQRKSNAQRGENGRDSAGRDFSASYCNH